MTSSSNYHNHSNCIRRYRAKEAVQKSSQGIKSGTRGAIGQELDSIKYAESLADITRKQCVVKLENVKINVKQLSNVSAVEKKELKRIRKEKRIRDKLLLIFGSTLDDVDAIPAKKPRRNKTDDDDTNLRNINKKRRHNNYKNKTDKPKNVQIEIKALKFEIQQTVVHEEDYNFVFPANYIAPEVVFQTADVVDVSISAILQHDIASPPVVNATPSQVKNMALFYVNLTTEENLQATVSIVQSQSEQANAPAQELPTPTIPALSPIGSSIPPQVEAVLPEKSRTSSLTIGSTNPSLTERVENQVPISLPSCTPPTSSQLVELLRKPSSAINLPPPPPPYPEKPLNFKTHHKIPVIQKPSSYKPIPTPVLQYNNSFSSSLSNIIGNTSTRTAFPSEPPSFSVREAAQRNSNLSKGDATQRTPPQLLRLQHHIRISQETLCLKVHSHLRDYLRWKALCYGFYNATRQIIPYNIVLEDTSVFSAYMAQMGKMYSNRLLTDLSKYQVHNIDLPSFISTLVGMLNEDGLHVNSGRVLTNLEAILVGSEDLCCTALTKLIYNFVATYSRLYRDGLRSSQQKPPKQPSPPKPLFSAENLELLKKQIIQYHSIKSWLDCRQCRQSKSPPSKVYNNFPASSISQVTNKRASCIKMNQKMPRSKRQKTNETQLEINGEISKTLRVLSSPSVSNSRLYSPYIPRTVEQLPERVTTSTNAGTLDSTDLNQTGGSQSSENADTISEALTLADADLLIDINERCNSSTTIQSEGIIRLSSSSTNAQTIVQTNSPPKTITSSDDERGVIDTSSEVQTPSTFAGSKDLFSEEDDCDLALKHEVIDLKFLILNEDSIDLTWMDDDVYNDITGEAFEPKMELLKDEKTEDIAESNDNVTSTSETNVENSEEIQVAPSSSEPNLEEPQEGDVPSYKCLCGSSAVYVCACKKSMYCSSKCQLNDWTDHRGICENANKQI